MTATNDTQDTQKTETLALPTKETTTMKQIKISDNAKALFVLYAEDAGNWGGTPLVGGNVELLSLKQDRGLLTNLKRAGLITTFRAEGEMWVEFTAAGRDLAVSLVGLDVIPSK